MRAYPEGIRKWPVSTDGGVLAAWFDAAGFENQYSVAPDGKRLRLMPLLAPEAAPTQVHLVLNWLEELRRRVPSK